MFHFGLWCCPFHLFFYYYFLLFFFFLLFVFLLALFFFLQELKKEMNLDPTFLDYRHRIQDTPEAYPDCVIHQEIILQKGHLWLPKDSPIIHTIITEFHNTPTRGHMGVAKTMERVGENFIWPSMRKDIKLFVSVCLVCQQTKNDHRKSTRLLCLLPVPARPWEAYNEVEG